MKIQLVWKDPGYDDGARHSAGVTPEQRAEIDAALRPFKEAGKIGEYLEVEVDTETGQVTVLGSY